MQQGGLSRALARMLAREMKAMYIGRHYVTVSKLLKKVLNGQHESHYITADVGAEKGLQQPGVHNKRSPPVIVCRTSSLR